MTLGLGLGIGFQCRNYYPNMINTSLVVTERIEPRAPALKVEMPAVKLFDVEFDDAAAVRAAMGLSGPYAPLVGGKVPDANLPPYAPLVGGKVPDANLPNNLVRTSDIFGIGSSWSGTMNGIYLPGVAGTLFPYAITPIDATRGTSLGNLPFSILFPRIALDRTYLDSPPSGACPLFRIAQSGTAFGHCVSILLYPQGNIHIRHYAASSVGPGISYIGEMTLMSVQQMAENGPFSLAVINDKTTPKIYHNGVVRTTNSFVNATPPVDGWASPVADGYAMLNYSSAIALSFRGTIVPPLILLGALSSNEASVWGKTGVLPGWAMYATDSTEISSGSLLTGRRYRITDNSGGADFVSAGAASNAVGTEFTVFSSTAVTPTWGTGKVVQLGLLFAPQAAPIGANILPDATGRGRSWVLGDGAQSISQQRSGIFDYVLTWSGTHEAKSLYDTNAYFPPGSRLDYLILEASDNVTVDVGDGTTGTYYASAQSLSAGVPLDVPLSNKLVAGLRVTVDPASDYTGTIRVKGSYSV